MELFKSTIASITNLNEEMMKKAQERQDLLIKPTLFHVIDHCR